MTEPHITCNAINDNSIRSNPTTAAQAIGAASHAMHDSQLVHRPKEHGAYAILGVPLCTAFLMVGPNWIGLLTAVASLSGFLAHEPVMIVAGRRGQRALHQSSNVLQRLIFMLGVTSLFGVVAFWLSNNQIRSVLIVCLVMAAMSFIFSASGWQRSLAAQLLGCCGLVLPSLIVLLGASTPLAQSMRISLAWMIGQSVALIAVRSVIAGQRQAQGKRVPLLNDIIQLGLSFAAMFGVVFGYSEAVYVLPMIVAALWLRLRPPTLQHLRRVGWTLVAFNVLSAAWMIIGFHR